MEILTWAQVKTIKTELFPLFRKLFEMVFSINVFRNNNKKRWQNEKKNVEKCKKRALNKKT